MYISHKSNVIQASHEAEWQCRRLSKGMTKSEYGAWVDSVTSGDPPVADYSGETGYTIVECRDENVRERLNQLRDYIENGVYNIKWQDDIGDAEEIKHGEELKDDDGKSRDPKKYRAVGEISYDPKQYVQSHFIPDDTAKDARLLAEQWTSIRRERDNLLANCDWTQGADSPLASGKKTEWATYRTKLRTLPEDQKAKTTYASITWPSEPS